MDEDRLMLALERVCDGKQHSRFELRAVAREIMEIVRDTAREVASGEIRLRK